MFHSDLKTHGSYRGFYFVLKIIAEATNLWIGLHQIHITQKT